MRLLLMRHGTAERMRPDDYSRQLTVEGVAGVRHTCEQLMERRLEISEVVASPLLRAQQTARIVVEMCAPTVVIQTWAEVAPDGSCQVVACRLDREVGLTPLVVTHEPFVSDMIEFLTMEKVQMKTGMIVCISADVFSQHAGRLEWLAGD